MGYELMLNVATKFYYYYYYSLSSKIETFERKCISLQDVSIERTVWRWHLQEIYVSVVKIAFWVICRYFSVFNSFYQRQQWKKPHELRHRRNQIHRSSFLVIKYRTNEMSF